MIRTKRGFRVLILTACLVLSWLIPLSAHADTVSPAHTGSNWVGLYEGLLRVDRGVVREERQAKRIGHLDEETYSGSIIVKFREGLTVRYNEETHQFEGARDDLSRINALVKDYTIKRVFRALTEDGYDRQRVELEKISGKVLRDMNLYYEIMVSDLQFWHQGSPSGMGRLGDDHW